MSVRVAFACHNTRTPQNTIQCERKIVFCHFGQMWFMLYGNATTKVTCRLQAAGSHNNRHSDGAGQFSGRTITDMMIRLHVNCIVSRGGRDLSCNKFLSHAESAKCCAKKTLLRQFNAIALVYSWTYALYALLARSNSTVYVLLIRDAAPPRPRRRR